VHIKGHGLISLAAPNRAHQVLGRHWSRKTAKGTFLGVSRRGMLRVRLGGRRQSCAVERQYLAAEELGSEDGESGTDEGERTWISITVLTLSQEEVAPERLRERWRRSGRSRANRCGGEGSRPGLPRAPQEACSGRCA